MSAARQTTLVRMQADADDNVDALDDQIESETEPEPEAAPRPETPRKRPAWQWIALAVLVGFVGVQSWRVARFDVRDGPLVGDQASHLMQAQSLAEDGDLVFDAGDHDRFLDVGWGPPRGLFFQVTDDGYAFAKPYGYSVFATPFVMAFGAVGGFAAANAVLLVVLTAACHLILRSRLDDLPALALSTVFVFGSNAYPFAYVIHPDLFLATLTSLVALVALQVRRDPRPWLVAVLAALMSFGVSEKPTLGLVYTALGFAAMWQHRTKLTAVASGVVSGLVALVVAVIPYLRASGNASWNPYAGDRFITPNGDVPFDATPETATMFPTMAERFFSLSYWREVIGEEGREIAESAVYVFVGRHTGMLPFLSAAFVLTAVIVWRRRSDWNRDAVLAASGLAAYVGFYVVLFPFNYFGGGQTVGNRYLLQVIPALLVVVELLQISQRTIWRATAVAAVLSLLFMGPSHRDPDRAFWLLARSSIAQELLPFEYDRRDEIVFACGTYERAVIIATGDDICLQVSGVQVERIDAEVPGDG